jgi:hypothetical protein
MRHFDNSNEFFYNHAATYPKYCRVSGIPNHTGSMMFAGSFFRDVQP